MSGESDVEDPLDEEGPAAPPRANGELVFTEPWQSRLFGTTMRLHETGRIEWERFRQGLIEQIARHEDELEADPARTTEDYDYWGCWQHALEQLLDEVGLVGATELSSHAAELASRPAGHDHDHDHDHHHGHDHH
jgi:nitrile hydratase accessory protein